MTVKFIPQAGVNMVKSVGAKVGGALAAFGRKLWYWRDDLSPINARRLANFTANRRGYWSLIIFSVLFYWLNNYLNQI